MIIDEKHGAAWSPFVRRATALVAALAAAFIGMASVPPLFAVDAAGAASTSGITGLPCAAPLVGNWRVSMPFGEQMNPITGKPYLHTGIDLTNGTSGNLVHSTLDGLVIETGIDEAKGRYVVIANARVEVCFQKLKEIRVAIGQSVAVGSEIGTVGSSGVSTGPHLRYEVWVGGIAVDPGALLRAGNAAYEGL